MANVARLSSRRENFAVALILSFSTRPDACPYARRVKEALVGHAADAISVLVGAN